MRRRTVVALGIFGLVAPPVAAQAAKVPRIGLLGAADLTGTSWITGLRAGLRELGYGPGTNIDIATRSADGRFDRLADLAAELVRMEVDIIVAIATQASLAAMVASRTIPIVMVGVADPVAVGLVDSLARPGGNVTGTSGMSADLVGKQMELFRELDPGLARLGVLWNPANRAFQTLQVREAEIAGRRLAIELRFLEARGPEEFPAAFTVMRQEGIRAVHVLPDPVYTAHRHALLNMIGRDRLVAISGNREFAEAGGLIAFGPSYYHASRRAAFYVDRILKGAKPADLPVEQPTIFELAVNLRTARALDLAIPPAILARADEVIE
jgi:putative ABC transport system substrate-binding protein